MFGWNMNYAHIILFYLTRVTCQVFLAYHTENCNWWPVRSWKKATVNILEHQSTRSWWILSARVCIVDFIRVKAHNLNRVSKQETLGLKPIFENVQRTVWRIWILMIGYKGSTRTHVVASGECKGRTREREGWGKFLASHLE